MEKLKMFFKKNRFLVFLFLFSFILRVGVVLLIDTPITSDFKTMFEASLEIINNSFSYKENFYFKTWGYQMGHVIYQSLLLSIINKVIFLKLVNALITSITVVFIYLILKDIVSDTSAKIVSVIYSIFLFPLLLNTVLTNQLLPMLLVLISCYLLKKLDYDKFISKSIVIGLLLGLSNVFRSEGIVVIFALFLYSLYLIFKKTNYKKVLGSFVIILLMYTSIFNLISFSIKEFNLNSSGLENNNPMWKFVLGFNHETNGMYSERDARLYTTDEEKSKEIVLERIKEYKKLPLLFLKKIKVQWFNSDLSWSIGHIENKDMYKFLNTINQIFIYIFHFFAFYSLLSLFDRKISNIEVFISLVLLTYFGVYLLIEVMPRYAYSLQIFEMFLVGIGIDQFIIKKLKSS